MLLESILPFLTSTWYEIFFFVGTGLSIILLVYAVFIEQEHRRDIMFLLGSLGLMVYAISIKNTVFTVAMGALALASLVEFVEILIGVHKHGPEDLKRYKEMWHIKKNK